MLPQSRRLRWPLVRIMIIFSSFFPLSHLLKNLLGFRRHETHLTCSLVAALFLLQFRLLFISFNRRSSLPLADIWSWSRSTTLVLDRLLLPRSFLRERSIGLFVRQVQLSVYYFVIRFLPRSTLRFLRGHSLHLESWWTLPFIIEVQKLLHLVHVLLGPRNIVQNLHSAYFFHFWYRCLNLNISLIWWYNVNRWERPFPGMFPSG